jgi:hypothetical protein
MRGTDCEGEISILGTSNDHQLTQHNKSHSENKKELKEGTPILEQRDFLRLWATGVMAGGLPAEHEM